MAENATTLPEKWQKQQQEHPEWTPALEDLLYFIHGTGSDRDRVYTLDEIKDLISYWFHSLRVSGSTGGVAETTVEPGKVSTYAGDGFEARLQGGGLLRLGGNGIGVYSTSGETETLVGSILYDRTNNKFSANVPFEANPLVIGPWSLEKTQYGDFIMYGKVENTKTGVLKVYNGGTIEIIRETKFMSKAVFGDVIDGTVPPNGQKKELHTKSNLFVDKDGNNSDGNIEADGDITAHGNLNVDLRIVSGNVLLAYSDVDLTGSPYNGSGYAVKTEMTIANSSGTNAITVTYGTGQTVVLPKHSARKFIKIDTSLWIQLYAYDPQAH